VSELVALPGGALARRANGRQRQAVVLVNGGQSAEVQGTWSSTLEWLVRRLAPREQGLAFLEVRYRIKSWRRLDLCIEDAREALEVSGAERVLLVGFSMGGAVAASVAGDPRVSGVLGLAPWLPDRLDVSALHAKRLDVLHGSLDRWLPGIPGVSVSLSRRGFERALAAGAEGSYTVIPGGIHGIALRRPGGGLVPLPRAGRWARLVQAQVEAFAAAG